jgi:hypothetical protein
MIIESAQSGTSKSMMFTRQDSQMKGRVFEYWVLNEYHVRTTFLEEDQLHWEYLSAPNGLTGTNSTEQIERTQVRSDILIVRWEADGTNVLDVFDLGKMINHINVFQPNGERVIFSANMTEMSASKSLSKYFIQSSLFNSMILVFLIKIFFFILN